MSGTQTIKFLRNNQYTFSVPVMLKSILITTMVFLSIPMIVTEAMAQDKQTRINIGQMTFEEIISELSKIFEVEITLASDLKEVSKRKINLNLEQTTLKQAIKEAIRKAGLQSYAQVMDQQKKSTRIWILPAGTKDAISSLEIDNNMKAITHEKCENLEPAESENVRMMTKEEFEHLEQESKEGRRGMTPEKFENLEQEHESKEGLRGMTPDEFKALESAESKNFRMMTQEKFDRLGPASEENYRGMTPEEFAKLKQGF